MEAKQKELQERQAEYLRQLARAKKINSKPQIAAFEKLLVQTTDELKALNAGGEA